MTLTQNEIDSKLSDIEIRTQLLRDIAVKRFSVTEVQSTIKLLNGIIHDNIANNLQRKVAEVANTTLELTRLVTFLSELQEETRAIIAYQDTLKDSGYIFPN